MIYLFEAIKLIEDNVNPLAPEAVPLTEALGCRLKQDVIAEIDIPPFNNSAMDGFAFHHTDFSGEGPWSFPIMDVIAAGDSPTAKLLPGNAVKIMTGAPMIDGSDTVIKIESVVVKDGKVIVDSKPELGSCVRPRGEDVNDGDLLFQRGKILSAVDLGLLASIGKSEIKVTPRPKVCLVATGSELIQPGYPLEFGQIYDSNRITIQSLLDNNGFKKITSMTVTGEYETLKNEIENQLASHDMLITIGGVSMGDFDHIPRLVNELGGEVVFHKVKVKPGKPIFLAKFTSISTDPKWLVGLPGNPVSAVVSYHTYVKRIQTKLMDLPPSIIASKAILAENIRVKVGRLKIISVTVVEKNDGLIAYPIGRQSSGRLSSLKGANAFIQIQPDVGQLYANSEQTIEWL